MRRLRSPNVESTMCSNVGTCASLSPPVCLILVELESTRNIILNFKIFRGIKPLDLIQDTHACFFSLLRDIICSTQQHRMRLDRIEMKLKAWETNPISPLNDWFTYVPVMWSSLLDSALNFLSGDYPGEDF